MSTTYKEIRIPNEQVRDVALQFYNAAEMLWDDNNYVIIPTITNQTLSIELFLKCLSAYRIINPYNVYENGVGGGKVTADAIAKNHNLCSIFNKLDKYAKDYLISHYKDTSLYHNERNLKNLLSKYNSVFVDIRYLFEDKAKCLHSINPNELRKLMLFLKHVSFSIPGKTIFITT